MTNYVSLADQAFACVNRISCVEEHMAKPMYIDTRNCELVAPTFQTRSTVALTNGMAFYSSQSPQEILSAMENAKQCSRNLAMHPVAVSDHILIDPMHIVAVLPYIAHLCDHVEDHGYLIHSVGDTPQCLIIMDDGDTCLAVNDTPDELVDKLNSLRQA